MGKKAKGTTHTICRRCGQHSYHKKKKYCSHCGFRKSAKIRNYAMTGKKVNRTRKD